MANERQATVLSELRTNNAQLDELVAALVNLRARFNSIGGTAEFQGAGKLFAADGSGQEIPYNDFLGVLNALGGLEGSSGTPAEKWSAFLAAIQRARG